MVNFECKNPAYDALYLEDMMTLHGFFFSELQKYTEYDLFSMIDVYMRYSDIRAQMDEGNPSALNKRHKQLLNSVDYSKCKKRTTDVVLDDILLDWMGDVYVLLQWYYNIPSAEISRLIPAETLADSFNPLHETSLQSACRKLYRKFIEPSKEDRSLE